MPHIPRAVCCQCYIEMKPHQNGVRVEAYTETLLPYYKIGADLYKCPKCSNEILIGFAQAPLAEWHDEDYSKWPTSVRVILK